MELDAAPGLIDAVEADLGPLSVLVTNTGGPSGGDPLKFTRDQWEDAYRELVLSPMALIEHAAPGMRERGFGRILSVSSSSAREPIPALLLSTAHRSALLATFKLLAGRLAPDGVTLNTILPGRFGTDRLVEVYGSLDAAEEAARSDVPIGRLGTIEEIGAAAAFLCSQRASYITGVALPVDGGLLRAT
jgi:3-oxoacyl-[acyl-carrier protein] reductase